MENENATAVPAASAVENAAPIKNVFWTEKIPRLNIITFILVAVMLLADTIIMHDRTVQLSSYFSSISSDIRNFLIFIVLESFVFRKKFTTSESRFDGKIYGLIVLRNVYYMVLMSPLAPLFAYLFFFSLFVSWIPFVVYIVLIWMRFKELKKVA
ncbi:MAG TPA: hypothetical protein VJ579_04940 [Candidatus Paceibacterota bacterium]|nr:hypothetical protein [Candidatus Paceibacterota bacterium]